MKKILLVEDELDLTNLYADLLKDAGFEVNIALDGADASLKASKPDWDLMLLDVMLPDKDGLTILEEVRQQPDGDKRPVIVLTNLNNEEVAQRATSLGAKEILIKSEVSLDDIVSQVKKHI